MITNVVDEDVRAWDWRRLADGSCEHAEWVGDQWVRWVAIPRVDRLSATTGPLRSPVCVQLGVVRFSFVRGGQEYGLELNDAPDPTEEMVAQGVTTLRPFLLHELGAIRQREAAGDAS